MPGRHPDDDALADLAADVLPAADARAVEAHVLACDRCAALLEDAERVRGLLLADDPGPVPAQVWHRIEAALAAEARPSRPAAADTAAFQAFVAGPDGADRTPPGAPLPPEPVDATAQAPGWADEGDPLDDPDRWAAPRALRAGGSSRRRDARTDDARRRMPVLLVAAAAVVLFAAVGGVVRLARSDSGSASFTASGGAQAADEAAPPPAAAAAGVGAAVVLRSGRAYREKTLAKEGGALVAAATSSAKGPQSASTPPRRASGGALATMDASADDLSNPAKLTACLAALGVAQDRLLAVDLATYEGREAAILLLRTSDGAYEVWAVERTCAAGNEGALKYTRLSG